MADSKIVSIDAVIKRLKQMEKDAEKNLTISDAPTLLGWIIEYRRELEQAQQSIMSSGSKA